MELPPYCTPKSSVVSVMMSVLSVGSGYKIDGGLGTHLITRCNLKRNKKKTQTIEFTDIKEKKKRSTQQK